MKRKLIISTLLIAGIVLAVNFVSNELHVRLDLTESRQYTLSDATQDILDNLEQAVTVKAYFSSNLPPSVAKTRQDFQDLLVEFANRSDGMVAYEFINPLESQVMESQALDNGIQPVMINVRERDQMKQQKAFLGASIVVGEERESIPLIQPGAAMEYALSTAIKKLSVKSKPAIGFLQGHGEPAIQEMMQAIQQLSVLYEGREVRLDSGAIPPEVKTLVIARPMDSIPPSHLVKVDQFMQAGGRVMVAINRVQGNLQESAGRSVNTGLDGWLRNHGIAVENAFVADVKCGGLSVQEQQGFFTLQRQISFPYLPAAASFNEHPITKGLEAVVFEFVSPVSFVGDSSQRFTPLVYSSDHSSVQRAPVYFDLEKNWTDADFPNERQILAAAVEGKSGRMVVIGDGDLAVNGSGEQARRLAADNVNLFVNAIDWLSDDTGLIDLRTKNTTNRPIRDLDESTKNVVKYANFAMPILLIVGYGLFRMQRNRSIRVKRMNEKYYEETK